MKRKNIKILVQWGLVIVLVFLASGIIENPVSRVAKSVVMGRISISDIQEAWTAPKAITPLATKTDMPTRSPDEVSALVYNYLVNKGDAMTIFPRHLSLLDWLGKARPYFTATYQSNSKWQVWGVGNDGAGATGNLSGGWGGLWYVYEQSGIIEPGNDKARELLNYIQWCTR